MAEGDRVAGWPLRCQGSARVRGRRPSPIPPYSLRLVAACAGEPRCAAAAAGRLQGGREGVLHGGGQDIQARARPAGRGDGARHYREPQGQGRERALPGAAGRQQGQRQPLPRNGPPPPRRLCYHPYLRPTGRRCPRPERPPPSRDSRSPVAQNPSASTAARGVAQRPGRGCGARRFRMARRGGSAGEGVKPHPLRFLVDR